MNELERWAADRLIALGWSREMMGQPFSLEAALVEYQQFHGLAPTGQLDEATLESLRGLRLCGHVDRMVVGELRRAPTATWRFMGPSLPSVPDADVRRTIQESFDRWSRVAPISAREAAAGEVASIQIAVASMDGRNGVLADCELPGPTLQHMRMDGAEVWTVIVPPNIPGGRIGMGNVLTHELGHFWGMDHIATGNLMAPIYDPMLIEPQAGDIAVMKSLYPGSPAAPPASPPPPSAPVPPAPPAGESVVTVVIRGARKIEIPGYKVVPA